jgi:hypothetical protein
MNDSKRYRSNPAAWLMAAYPSNYHHEPISPRSGPTSDTHSRSDSAAHQVKITQQRNLVAKR